MIRSLTMHGPALLTLVSPAFAAAQATGGIAGSIDLSQRAPRSCETAADRDAMRRAHALWLRGNPAGVGPRSVSSFRMPHYPMAGVLDEDALTGLWMDLDPAAGAVLDWNCTDRTYDGHEGIDTGIPSWAEQLIGVPVFAAADGTVYFAQDGWPDMNTQGGVQGNIVGVDHGNGYQTSYWHLKNGSVAVSVGQLVKAGEQIAMVASSGNSFGPHLHLGVEQGLGNVIDPNEGPCNAVPSLWVHPLSIDSPFHLYDAGVSRVDLTPYYPPDVMPATNQLLLSDPYIRFWNWMVNLPPSSTWRVVFVRPNGTVAFDSFDVPFGNPVTYTQWWTWWQYDVAEMHTLAGTWRVDFQINGALQWSAPVEVRATLDPTLNHAPAAITAAFEPPLPTQDEPVYCRVSGSLVQPDVDWQVVRYRYVWKVNGATVRDVTTAARTDAIAHHVALTGQALTCTVTPSDGVLAGPSAMASATIQAACAAPTSYCIAAANSTGVGAVISGAGTTSLSHDDFTLCIAGGVPHKLGIFFYGATPGQIPFANGYRCVLGVTQRLYPPIASDANGEVAKRVPMLEPPIASGPFAIASGSTWYFQYWYRDPDAGGANVNFSDGLAATFCP